MKEDRIAMTFEILDISVMRAVYDGHLVSDFPADEVKPFSSIERMYSRGEYFGYGFFDEQMQLLAYAFFVKGNECEWLLLDYFAVVSTARGRGVGTKAISLLRDELSFFDGILIECEDPMRVPDGAQRRQRERRIAFYERLGALLTGVGACVYGVDYSVLCLPLRARTRDGDVYSALRRVYSTMFNSKQLKEKVKTFRKEQY